MKRLVLLGGGHAHLQVLRALAQERLPVAEVLLITPYAGTVYSGMVPGLVAGHYAAVQCSITIAPLAAAAGVRVVEAAAVGLDAGARSVRLSDGRSAEYDVLSIDTGSVQHRDALPGAREHGLFIRPMEHFVRLQQALADLAAQRPLDVVVLGGGAAGFELALALQHRLRDGLQPRGEERVRVALVTGGTAPLEGYPAAAMRAGARELAARRVTVFRERAVAIEAAAVVLASGARLACDAPVIATGAEAPEWLTGSGLALCERGFVRTGATLQSASHPEVFAAGDVAMREDAPHPRSGVYAVRAGPPLALNLRRFVGDGPLVPYQPQQRTLNLLSCGNRSAIAVWGGFSAHGRWAWWWKDRIDRGFMARFAAPAATPAA
jgi:selenide,water dikinase